MGQQLHDLGHLDEALEFRPLLGVSRRRGATDRRRAKRLGGDNRLAHLGGDEPGEFAIGRVAGLDGDEMPLDGPAQQRQIAHNIQHLVPHEFLRVPQRLGGQHRVIANHHGVLQAAAADQAVLDEIFDFLVKTEGARMRQLSRSQVFGVRSTL